VFLIFPTHFSQPMMAMTMCWHPAGHLRHPVKTAFLTTLSLALPFVVCPSRPSNQMCFLSQIAGPPTVGMWLANNTCASPPPTLNGPSLGRVDVHNLFVHAVIPCLFLDLPFPLPRTLPGVLARFHRRSFLFWTAETFSAWLTKGSYPFRSQMRLRLTFLLPQLSHLSPLRIRELFSSTSPPIVAIQPSAILYPLP